MRKLYRILTDLNAEGVLKLVLSVVACTSLYLVGYSNYLPLAFWSLLDAKFFFSISSALTVDIVLSLFVGRVIVALASVFVSGILLPHFQDRKHKKKTRVYQKVRSATTYLIRSRFNLELLLCFVIFLFLHINFDDIVMLVNGISGMVLLLWLCLGSFRSFRTSRSAAHMQSKVTPKRDSKYRLSFFAIAVSFASMFLGSAKARVIQDYRLDIQISGDRVEGFLFGSTSSGIIVMKPFDVTLPLTRGNSAFIFVPFEGFERVSYRPEY